ncbi:hypothetical protein ACS0OQ_11165 [Stenotrophomonas riyadhensis]|uniref:hypothetical protein n=1 Tax=Stenotrophomonas riyadhensis TaxID=2859893 RepID=UPI003F951816
MSANVAPHPLDLEFCTLGYQHGDQCAARVARADHAMELVHQALETVFALKRNRVARFEQMDLFSQASDDELIAFWWGVHRACGVEFRRLLNIFWTRCPHKSSHGRGNEP